MKVMVNQLDILETMTPMSFRAFRDRLDRASGFQSMQFREFEFVLGLKRSGVLKNYQESLYGLDAARRRLNERSVVDSFNDFLEHRGVRIPGEVKELSVTSRSEPNEEIQDGLHHLFVSDPQLAVLFELMLDFDEGQQEWRYRHVKLVERTIGNKKGTGGSLGVEFLKKTLFIPVFPDLWAIRHRL
jgi:tryptophan 2,3-dioxygenase